MIAVTARTPMAARASPPLRGGVVVNVPEVSTNPNPLPYAAPRASRPTKPTTRSSTR